MTRRNDRIELAATAVFVLLALFLLGAFYCIQPDSLVGTLVYQGF